MNNKSWMLFLILPLLGIGAMIAILISGSNTSPDQITEEDTAAIYPTPQAVILPTPTPGTPRPSLTPLPAIINEPVPAITLEDMSGETFTLADFRGQRLIINFWATWCAPCRDEMPALQRFSDEQGEDGIIVLGITSSANNQTRQQIEKFIDELDLTFRMGLDETLAMHQAFQIRPLPITFFVDAQGITRGSFIGGLSYEQIQREVDYIFNES